MKWSTGLLIFIVSFLPLSIKAQTYTPTAYSIELFTVELSTDGTNFIKVFENTSGLSVDLADSSSFNNAFGDSVNIPSGTYSWIRMTISEDLVWSHPAAPVSLSNQTFTVSGGPPGPTADQMTVYFATHDQGGKPGGQGGGQGTQAAPMLLGSSAKVEASRTTTLRLVFSVTDALKAQGGSSYDLAPPDMFFVSENTASSTLSGNFNTTVYNAIKEFSSDGMGGYNVDSWSYTSGRGVLNFDGSGRWTWNGILNEFNLQGGASGALNNSAAFSGTYGLNADGSIWMLVSGEPGTMRGAISSDQSMLVLSMYDSPSSHMMIFGVSRATNANVSSFNGNYYFTTYESEYKSGSNSLSYEGSFGTVTANGSGGITGIQDRNEIEISQPTTSPVITAPVSSLGNAFADTLTITSNGLLSGPSDHLLGAILENGEAATIASSFQTTYQPKNQFGFIVKQSPSGTFTAASLNGTYYGGHFGDSYDSTQGESNYYSGFFQVTFDGQGQAQVTIVENEEGIVKVKNENMTYTVDSSSGTVSFFESGVVSSVMGAIGPRAESFILTSSPIDDQSQASDNRFLGLGLRQGS